MKFLICNDDGYQSAGIALLARIASEWGEVRVVAPDRDQSAISHALTLDRPMRMRQMNNGFYAVNGTPTDCVHIGAQVMDDFHPDWVLSGVNHGVNMGDDTLYSGTVAAAMEGFMLGIPSVAFSLDDKSNRFWDTAEKAIMQIMPFLANYHPQQPCLWNVNIPRVHPEDLQGLQITRLGRRRHGNNIVAAHDPLGERVYWIGRLGEIDDNAIGTDFEAAQSGFVSLTPLTVDRTEHSMIESLHLLFKDFSL